VALTVKARIRGLDWSLEDAAADLGSPPLRTFVKVTLPMIVPGIAAAFLLSIALSIDDYIITSFVAGGVSTLPREIFDSSRAEIPAQVHVLATLVMGVAIAIIVAGTLIGRRRVRKLSGA
jgi:spermidine/putrescine transport system permease protein